MSQHLATFRENLMQGGDGLDADDLKVGDRLSAKVLAATSTDTQQGTQSFPVSPKLQYRAITCANDM